MDFYVYIHRRNDTGEIFYVGEGTVKYRRAYQKTCRNPHWANVSKKHGYTVEIWSYWPDQQSAFEEEIKVIAFLKSLGVQLTNKTAGGEGRLSHNPSEETRRKLSAATKGRPALHLRTPLEVKFLNEESKVFASVTEAAKEMGVSRRLVRLWQTGKANPNCRNIESVTKIEKGKME